MKRLLTLAVLIVLIGAWQALSNFSGIPRWLLPPPSLVVSTAISSSVLASNILITVKEFLLAFFIASLSGIVFGVLLAKAKLFRSIAYPYIVIIGSLPASCFAPIINLWLGIGYISKVVVGVIMSGLVIILTTSTGVARIDPSVKEAAKLDGASALVSIFKIELPLALPNIYTGLRMGWAMALIGAVVSELYGAYGGLGYYIFVQTKTFHPTQMFAGVISLALISYFGFVTFDQVEKHTVSW